MIPTDPADISGILTKNMSSMPWSPPRPRPRPPQGLPFIFLFLMSIPRPLPGPLPLPLPLSPTEEMTLWGEINDKNCQHPFLTQKTVFSNWVDSSYHKKN